MAKELESSDLPIVVEPSVLYCIHGNKKCVNRLVNYRGCKAAATFPFKEIPKNLGNKAPDWCPHKWMALFPPKG